MCYVFPIPHWFVGFDVALEILLVVITVLVALFSINVYRIIPLRNVRVLAMAFGCIAIGYAIQAMHNSILFFGDYQHLCPPVSFLDTFSLTAVVLLFFATLVMAGLILMTFLSLKVRKTTAFWLLFLLAIFSILANTNMVFMFYTIATFFLIFISSHYLRLYAKNHRKSTLYIASAFTMLTLSYVQFLLALWIPAFYVSAHIFEVIAFVLILKNIWEIHHEARSS